MDRETRRGELLSSQAKQKRRLEAKDWEKMPKQNILVMNASLASHNQQNVIDSAGDPKMFAVSS